MEKGDQFKHHCAGSIRDLEHQLTRLGDAVESHSDTSDHRTFPIAGAWPKPPRLKLTAHYSYSREGEIGGTGNNL